MKTTDLPSQIARTFPLATVLMFGCVAAHAASCEDIRAGIESKLKAAGVEQYSLIVVDTAATAPGKVVGSCDLGTKKIFYAKDPSAKAPSKAASSAILTECKDGSASVGGDCRR